MELSDRERLLLVEKKEEIRRLTNEILDLATNPANTLEIKKRFTSILAHLSTIASYSNPKDRRLELELDILRLQIDLLFNYMNARGVDWKDIQRDIEFLCNVINSIRFEYMKKDIKIHIPININIGK